MTFIHLKELNRTRWIYVFLGLELLFYTYIMYTEPLSAHGITLFLQVSFLLNMVYGANFAFRMTSEDYRDAMASLGTRMYHYIFASFLTIVLVNLIHFFLLTGISLVMRLSGHIPPWLFNEVFSLHLIYIFINNITCAVIGYLIGYLIQHRIKYLALLFLSFTVSPVSKIVLPYVSLFSWLNLGPYSVNIAQNPLYGFDTEVTRLFKFLTILLSLLLLLTLIITARIKSKKFLPVTLLLLASVIFSAWQWSQPAWLRRPMGSNGDPLAENNYDFKYYSMAPLPNPELYPITYEINHMNINVELSRQAAFVVDMTLTAVSDTTAINGSLYHGFRIREVLADSMSIPFHQDGEVFSIPLSLKEREVKKITLKYDGLNSPYFPGNYKAAAFPAFFNWLPLARIQPAAFIYDGYSINFSAAYNTNPIDYELTLQTKSGKEIFSSLDRSSDGVFRGKSNMGVSLYYGNLHQLDATTAYVVSITPTEIDLLTSQVQQANEKFQAVAAKYGLSQSGTDYKFLHGLWLSTSYNHLIGFEDFGTVKVSALVKDQSEEMILYSLINGSFALRRQPIDVQDVVFYMIRGLNVTIEDQEYVMETEKELMPYFKKSVSERERIVRELISSIHQGMISLETVHRIIGES